MQKSKLKLSCHVSKISHWQCWAIRLPLIVSLYEAFSSFICSWTSSQSRLHGRDCSWLKPLFSSLNSMKPLSLQKYQESLRSNVLTMSEWQRSSLMLALLLTGQYNSENVAKAWHMINLYGGVPRFKPHFYFLAAHQHLCFHFQHSFAWIHSSRIPPEQ